MTLPPTPRERLAQSSQPSGAARPTRLRDNGADKPPPDRRRRRQGGGWLRRIFAVFALLAAIGAAGAGIVGYGLYRHYSADLPDLATVQNYQPRVMSRVYAGDSRLLAELATERRIFVPYAAIPDLVKRAFLSAEDQNFFNHGGVDPLAILRAAATDLLQYGQGRRPVGASTITQQVAKNMLLGNEVSLARKVREALLAIRIEQVLPKERILELYLNEIYLGIGSYGVAAAGEAYFNKPLEQLTPAEAAFLAALPKGPNNYNPARFPEAARNRRDWVLDRMVDNHVITAAAAAAAKAEPVTPPVLRRPDMVGGADYFTEEVRRQLVDKFGADQTTQGGLVVRTSLDPALQVAADKALRDGLVRYDQSHGGWRGPVAQLPGGGALRTAWADPLAAVARPPGMLANWRLGVVTEIAGNEARLGTLEHPPGAAAPVQRVLPLLLADIAWARAPHDGTLGPAPRRIADVVQVGDVVMVEPVAASPAVPAIGKVRAAAATRERLLLRQIPLVQGALVSLDPATGRVLAMSGGWSYEGSQFNRATQAQRQPGSSFKPIVYLAAMEAGISPSQHFLDAPFVLDTGAGGRWRPGNYEMDFNGSVPLHVALEKSLNLVTVRVADQIGMEAVAAKAIAMHEVDAMPRVLPAALGAVDTTVLREAGAYAVLANGGKEVVPSLIDTVQDRNGHVVMGTEGLACTGCDDPSHPPVLADNRREVADPDSVFQTVMMMRGVVQRGTGTAAVVGLNRAVAGKTGTTQDFNDAWFAGFTPDLVTVVWIGFDTPASLGQNQTGGTLAAPVWHDFMAAALKGRPNLQFVVPPGMTVASYDSGFGTVTDAFKPGQVPGASTSDNTASAEAASDPNAAPATPGGGTAAAGTDSGLGGLY